MNKRLEDRKDKDSQRGGLPHHVTRERERERERERL
jgi:hypothetical protein